MFDVHAAGRQENGGQRSSATFSRPSVCIDHRGDADLSSSAAGRRLFDDIESPGRRPNTCARAPPASPRRFCFTRGEEGRSERSCSLTFTEVAKTTTTTSALASAPLSDASGRALTARSLGLCACACSLSLSLLVGWAALCAHSFSDRAERVYTHTHSRSPPLAAARARRQGGTRSAAGLQHKTHSLSLSARCHMAQRAVRVCGCTERAFVRFSHFPLAHICGRNAGSS